MVVSERVTEQFRFVEANVLVFEDLYGDKLHAALDRRHPRDLFDIGLLYDIEGLTDEHFPSFMVYEASSGRPMHELLAQSPPLREDLHDEVFVGMTREAISIEATGDIQKLALWLGHASLQSTEMDLRVDPVDKLDTLATRGGRRIFARDPLTACMTNCSPCGATSLRNRVMGTCFSPNPLLRNGLWGTSSHFHGAPIQSLCLHALERSSFSALGSAANTFADLRQGQLR